MEPGARSHDAGADRHLVHPDDLHGGHRGARIAAQRGHRRGGRRRLAAVVAHHVGVLSPAFHAAPDGHGGRSRRRHGRRALHVFGEHPAKFPARRTGRQARADSAERGCHADEPGVHGQQLHPADRRRRDQRICQALPQAHRTAGRAGRAHALQPQPDAGVVRQPDGDHQ
ncbi:hypothetical protein D3C72_1352030 [compost metagenome]